MFSIEPECELIAKKLAAFAGMPEKVLRPDVMIHLGTLAQRAIAYGRFLEGAQRDREEIVAKHLNAAFETETHL